MAGFSFQAQVFAWWAACAVAGVNPGLGLAPSVRIDAVGCETDFLVDDVAVALSDGGFILVQAKAGMRRLSADASDLRLALEQLIAALTRGLHCCNPPRRVDVARDRLMIATNSGSSSSFERLGKVCARLRDLPRSLPLEAAAKSESERRSLEVFLRAVRSVWDADNGRGPTESEIRDFLEVAEFRRFDFEPESGADYSRIRELLRRASVGRPFSVLESIGMEVARERGWRQTRALMTAVRMSDDRGGRPPVDEASAPRNRRNYELGAVRLKDADPFQLGVHRSMRMTGVGERDLPQYVPREHDELLRTIVRGTDQASKMVVLVGDSSTGKTRALWEALRLLQDDWCLWAPGSDHSLNEGLADGAMPPRTVVWLDDAHNVLDPESTPFAADTAARLRDLISNQRSGQILVAATLWPEKWERLSAQPRWAASRPRAEGSGDGAETVAGLLNAAVCIQVPSAFGEHDLIRAREAAADDPALASAWANALSGKVTQYLAGAPKLRERYASAPPEARALVDTAIDARRLGYGNHIGQSLLLEAAAGYLDPDMWDLLPDGWGAYALSSMTRDWRGLPGPLRRIRPLPGEGVLSEPEYSLADVLEQEGGLARRYTAPPASFWTAVARRAHPNDLYALGYAAQRRCRYRAAASIYTAAAAGDDPWALEELAMMHYKAGNLAAAERTGIKAARTGHFGPLEILASKRAQARDKTGAIRLYELAAGFGDPEVRPILAGLLEESGDEAESERLAVEAGRDGDTGGLYALVKMRAKKGKHDDAERLALLAADLGNPGLLWLAAVYSSPDDGDEAIRLYRLAESFGDPAAMMALSSMLARTGRLAEAEEVAHEAARKGDTRPLVELAKSLRAEDPALSRRLYRRAAELGDGSALEFLAKAYAAAGRIETAETLAVRAAQAGETEFMVNLASQSLDAGDFLRAERLARKAADLGDADAFDVLAHLREREGRQSEAEQLALQAALGDADWTVEELVEQRENDGDYEGAERLALKAARTERKTQAEDWVVTSPIFAAIRRLIDLRESRGDYADAEQLAVRAVGHGYLDGLKDLADERRRRGDYQDAERLYEVAANAGDASALAGKAAMLEETGDFVAAKHAYQRAMNGGYEAACDGLAGLLERAGDTAGASNLRLYGADAEGNPAQPWRLDYENPKSLEYGYPDVSDVLVISLAGERRRIGRFVPASMWGQRARMSCSRTARRA